MNHHLPPELFKQWLHSREEDAGDVRVYRPAGYRLPPSRGRDGFELKANGEFIRYRIGPTDRPQLTAGTWQAAGADRISVNIPGENSESFTLQIVDFSADVLKVRLVDSNAM
jgi:hypothetical protein